MANEQASTPIEAYDKINDTFGSLTDAESDHDHSDFVVDVASPSTARSIHRRMSMSSRSPSPPEGNGTVQTVRRKEVGYFDPELYGLRRSVSLSV